MYKKITHDLKSIKKDTFVEMVVDRKNKAH